MEKNCLYYGDNLTVLREHIKDESVDLIYLDPSFNSRQDYNVLFAERDGTRSASQIMAFEDTWEWNMDAERAYKEIVERGGRVSDAMRAFRTFLGHSDMMAYLAMMAPRLIELRRVLKEMGSIYLHCDPTASHYLKILMDGVFGTINFRNEVIWKRTSARSDSHRWNHIHDTLLFYTKTDEHVWNTQYVSYDQAYVDAFYGEKDDTDGAFMSDNLTAAGTRNGESGLPWRGVNPTDKGRHWALPKKFLDSMGISGGTVQDRLDALDKLERVLWPEKEGGVPRFKRYLGEMPGWPSSRSLPISLRFLRNPRSALAIPLKNPKPCWSASSRQVPTKATPSSIHFADAARLSQSHNASTAAGSASTSPISRSASSRLAWLTLSATACAKRTK